MLNKFYKYFDEKIWCNMAVIDDKARKSLILP